MGHRLTMMILSRAILLVALFLTGAAFALAQTPQIQEQGPAARPEQVNVDLFWTAGCPHCLTALRFLDERIPQMPGVQLRSFPLDGTGGNEAAFVALSRHFTIEPPAVPLIIVGGEAFVGYQDAETTGKQIVARATACLATPCPDVVADVTSKAGIAIKNANSNDAAPSPRAIRPPLPQSVNIPILGDVDMRTLSLPVLTIILGAIDGFNPCAMWVLVFLIGLLIGMQDTFRMWTYGAVFLLTSGAVYFAFMAAWLNLFLFLGALAWIRYAIGTFAIAAGLYYLREFIRNPDAACTVTSPGQRLRLMERMQALVAERSFLTATAGIVTLAIGVNMIELLCSAGIPAVYTQVLAMSDLSVGAYYGYLALYIAVFMLDDAIIFVAAMLTLRSTGLASTYAHYSQLIGGVVLGGIGLMLILKPEWLTFT